MIYEFRIYEPHDGKSASLRRRFEADTMRVFRRVGVEVLAVLRPEPDDGRLCYVTRFADEGARQAAWSAFGADEEWRAVKAASEQDGPLLKSQSVVVLSSLSEALPAF